MKEQIVFPEINYDKVDKVRGMNITICTTAKNFVFHVECKRTHAWDFGQLLNKPDVIYGAMDKYIDQAINDCPSHRTPLLWLQHPGPSQSTYIITI